MIDVYVDEIRTSLENKQYYSALSLALILPDICGSIEFPNKSVSERYIGWYDRYIGVDLKTFAEKIENKHPYLSGEIVYNLRNTFLHNGQPDINVNKLKDTENRIDKFKLYVCDEFCLQEYTSSLKFEDTTIRVVLVDVRYLCSLIAECALLYYIEHKDGFSQDSEIHLLDKVEDLGAEMRKSVGDIATEYIMKLPGSENSKVTLHFGETSSITCQRITYERSQS